MQQWKKVHDKIQDNMIMLYVAISGLLGSGWIFKNIKEWQQRWKHSKELPMRHKDPSAVETAALTYDL